MASIQVIKDCKYPSPAITYTLDYAAHLANLGDSGDTLASSTWTVVDGDVTIEASSNTTTLSKVRVQGGTAGTRALLRNDVTFTTLSDDDDDRYLEIEILNIPTVS